MMNTKITVYVVRDANGEYVYKGERTTDRNFADEFCTRALAENACVRFTDRVLSWKIPVAHD